MPVAIERPSPENVARFGSPGGRRLRDNRICDRAKTIEIGLVNNMPDAALLATERQFSNLLAASSGGINVRLHLFALREVPRSQETRGALRQTYCDAGQIRGRHLDALIVTGAEPLAPTLEQEPYWRALTKLIDWAESNTVSTVLSCLAAHVGVKHLDGIARQPLPEKRSGIFTFEPTTRHKLVAGLGSGLTTPHSRRNGLDHRHLIRQNYQVLTSDPQIGVDTFIKQKRSLFVFLQGHPEYEDDSLAREYRRDMNRYLRGEYETLPAFPTGYFSAAVERSLTTFAERASLDRHPDLMAVFPDAGAIGPGDASWRKSAIRLYGNWLEYIAEQKAALLDEAPIAVQWGG
jgi:homoserine O-succinyltransferase